MRRTLWILLFVINIIQASDLQDNLTSILNKGYGTEYLKNYIQPLANSAGIAMNGAVYYRGTVKAFPEFDIGINTTYIFLPDQAFYFVSQKPSPGTSQQVPTIFGNKQPADDVVPGLALDAFQLPLMHLNVGLFNNMEIMFRISQFHTENFGSNRLIGGGFKYGLSDLLLIEAIPISFSVQAMYHSLNLDNYLSTGSFGMNLHASSSIPKTAFTVYAGATFENTSLVIKTNLLPVEEAFKYGTISLRGKSDFNFNIGLNAEFLIFNLHLDYNFSYYQSIASGLMLVF